MLEMATNGIEPDVLLVGIGTDVGKEGLPDLFCEYRSEIVGAPNEMDPGGFGMHVFLCGAGF